MEDKKKNAQKKERRSIQEIARHAWTTIKKWHNKALSAILPDNIVADENKYARFKRSLFFFLGYMALLCAFVIIVANIVVRAGTEVKMPKVVDTDALEAIADLSARGISVTAEYAVSAKTPKGVVANQNPKGGASVKKGRSAHLVISRGPIAETMPNFVGKQYEEAMHSVTNTLLVQDRGYVVTEPTMMYRPDTASNQVIGQRPRAGEPLFTGAAISFVISSGAPIDRVIVTNFHGEEYASVRAYLENAGVIVSAASTPAESALVGRVVEQSVSNGTLTRGMPITLTIGHAETGFPRTENKIHRFYFETPAQKDSYTVRVEIADTHGKRVIFDELCKKERPITLTVPYTGVMTITTYLDGQHYSETIVE